MDRFTGEPVGRLPRNHAHSLHKSQTNHTQFLNIIQPLLEPILTTINHNPEYPKAITAKKEESDPTPHHKVQLRVPHRNHLLKFSRSEYFTNPKDQSKPDHRSDSSSSKQESDSPPTLPPS